MLNWVQVREQLAILEAKVDDQFHGMKSFIKESFRKFTLEIRIEQNVNLKGDKSGLSKVLLNHYSFCLSVYIFCFWKVFFFCNFVFITLKITFVH